MPPKSEASSSSAIASHIETESETRAEFTLKVSDRKPGSNSLLVTPSVLQRGVPFSGTSHSPQLVEKQLSYHWRKVQTHALGNPAVCLAANEPDVIDLVPASRAEVGVQTEATLGPKTVPPSPGLFKLPEWYWSGVTTVPHSVSVPKKLSNASVNFRGLKKSVLKTLPPQRLSKSFHDVSELMQKVKPGDKASGAPQPPVMRRRVPDVPERQVSVKRRMSEIVLLTTAKHLEGRRSSLSPSNSTRGLSTPLRASQSTSFQDRMGRRSSIMDQATAHASSRNMVKKQVVQKLHRSLSRSTHDGSLDSGDLSENTLSADDLKSVWQPQRSRRKNLSRSSTNATEEDNSGTRFCDRDENSSSVTTRRKLLQPDDGLVMRDRTMRSKSVPKLAQLELGPIATEHAKPLKSRPPLQRSFTLDSFAANEASKTSLASKGIPSMREIGRKITLLAIATDELKEREREKERKRMRKEWDKTYTGMCNRAVVLNHVISRADQQNLEVKPINHWTEEVNQATDEKKRVDHEKKSQKKSEEDERIFIGLSNQFYHVSQEDDEESSEEDMNEHVTDDKSSDALTEHFITIPRSSTEDNLKLLSRVFHKSSVATRDASTQVNFAPLFCSRSESPDSSSRPPVERQVEARSGSEDGLGSMVRCLHFANTFIANRKTKNRHFRKRFAGINGPLLLAQTLSPTLWAGTNSGQILVFLLSVAEEEEKRNSQKATAILGKEIQLKHKAPVISIEVLDATGLPLTASTASMQHRKCSTRPNVHSPRCP